MRAVEDQSAPSLEARMSEFGGSIFRKVYLFSRTTTYETPRNNRAERIRLSDLDSPKHGTDNFRSDWLRPKALWPGLHLRDWRQFSGLIDKA